MDYHWVFVRTNNKDYENRAYLRLTQMDLTKKKVYVYLYAPSTKQMIPYMAGEYLNGVIDIPASAANFTALVVEE